MYCTTMRHLTLIFTLVSVSLAQTVPELTIQPSGDRLRKDAGSFAVFTCKVDKHDQLVEEIDWIDRNGQQVPLENPSIDDEELEQRTYTVPMADPKGLELYIKDVKTSDAGNYTCQARYGSAEYVTKSFYLEVYMSIRFTDAPAVQNPQYGSQAKIRCVASSQPAPEIHWIKSGRQITSGGRYIVEQDGLSVANITSDDDGTYVCRARVASEGDIKERKISVEVYSAPRLTYPENNSKFQIVEQNSDSIKCKAEGKPAPVIRWVNQQNADANQVDGLSVKDGVLHFSRVNRDMGGQYRCIAENSVGRQERTVQVVVLVQPYFIKYDNITVRENSSAVLKCEVGGYPVPEVKFRKAGNQSFIDSFSSSSSSSRIYTEIMNKSSGQNNHVVAVLNIQKVHRSDDGLYECVASNKAGHKQHNGHITVHYSPVFDHTPLVRTYSWLKRPTNITCVARAVPNATISWMFRGAELRHEKDANIKMFGNGPISRLQVTPVNTGYFGEYTCRAENQLGQNELKIELFEVVPPSAPLRISDKLITATSVEFAIEPPSNSGGLNITAFAVEYKLSSFTWNSSNNTVWPINSHYIVTHLLPEQNYVFRFAAKNDAGFSEWSNEIQRTLPRIAAPERPIILYANASIIPENTIVHSKYGNSYKVHWRAGPDNGEPIDSMKITFYQVKEASGGKWKQISDRKSAQVLFPDNRHYQLFDLTTNSYYQVELQAHNKLGHGRPALLIVKTGEYASAETRPHFLNEGVSVTVLAVCAVFLVLVVLLILDILCCMMCHRGLTHYLRARATSASNNSRHSNRKSTTDPREKEPLNDNNGHTRVNGDQLGTVNGSRDSQV